VESSPVGRAKVIRTLLVLIFAALVLAPAAIQITANARETQRARRSERTNSEIEPDPAQTLRSARTIYIEPSEHLDSQYLEYKLGKYPEFEQWKLAIVKDRSKADLVLSIHRRMLNYIFSIEDPQSSVVVVNGKVVAINDLVATDEMAKEVIRRMKSVRALPTN
jgi:hypothetical protein